MKTTKIIYYATTGIISGMMLFIAFETLTKPEVKASMAHLGFPDYFRIELGIAKIIGAVFLWLPFRVLKEVAYVGFAIMFASASYAHLVVGDPLNKTAAGMIFLAILIVSYACNVKLQKKVKITNKP